MAQDLLWNKLCLVWDSRHTTVFRNENFLLCKQLSKINLLEYAQTLVKYVECLCDIQVGGAVVWNFGRNMDQIESNWLKDPRKDKHIRNKRYKKNFI